MKSFKSFLIEEDKVKKGKEVSVGKNTVKINPDSEELKEVAPPGDTYERMVKHIKKSYSKGGLTDKEKSIAYATAWKQKNKDQQESAVPGKPAEKLGAVTAIPQSERDAAKARLLAKTAAKRKEMEKVKESLSFSDFMEARRMDKEGVDRGDSRRAERADRAKASLAAKQKRQAVLDKHEKKTGTKLDISRSKEGKEHARNFPGSRQEPKEKGKKETPLETHNRRVNRSNARVIKHGFTKKEKEANRGIYSSRFD